MKIKMVGLYGLNAHAYYRKLGRFGYDLVNDKKYATEFADKAECEKILAYKESYCKQYNAKDMVIVDD